MSAFEDPDLAFRRRGAPFTFDAEAIVKLVKALKATPVTTIGEPEELVYVPSFDHAVKDPLENGISISSRNRVIVVEGNYTLLDQKPWDEIAKVCDDRFVLGINIMIVETDVFQVVRRRTDRGGKGAPSSTPSCCRNRDLPDSRCQKSGRERYSEWRADKEVTHQARCGH